MVTDHDERPAVSKNFLKHVAKGGVKSIPMVGGLIDEMIFGTLEGEAAEKEAAKAHDGLKTILTESHAQSATLAELLAKQRDTVVFSGQTRAILDSVVEALRDIDAKLPSPAVTQGIERYVEKQLRTLPIALAKLPSTSPLLLGRDGELETLDEAWADPNTNVVTFVAFGGVGKTALVNKWLSQMREHGFRGAEQVLRLVVLQPGHLGGQTGFGRRVHRGRPDLVRRPGAEAGLALGQGRAPGPPRPRKAHPTDPRRPRTAPIPARRAGWPPARSRCPEPVEGAGRR